MLLAQGLCKKFGNQIVLNGIDLQVIPSQRLYIVGKSGVGKSVLLRLLIGLLQADAGEIFIDEQKVNTISEKEWFKVRSKFGYVFQGGALFDSLTVFENVTIKLKEQQNFSNDDLRYQAIATLNKVGISETHLNKFPAALSGGMRKRVAIARAIIHQPQYLLYDEPTTGLDPVTSAMVDELILELAQASAVSSIIVSHDIASVQKVATHVLFIHDTKTLFSGKVNDFFIAPNPGIVDFVERRYAV